MARLIKIFEHYIVKDNIASFYPEEEENVIRVNYTDTSVDRFHFNSRDAVDFHMELIKKSFDEENGWRPTKNQLRALEKVAFYNLSLDDDETKELSELYITLLKLLVKNDETTTKN